MFNQDDINEKIMEVMNKEFILKNAHLAMESAESYKLKAGFVPTDDRLTKDMKGIAVVPYIPLMEDEDGRATALVTYDVLDQFGITKDEFFDAAYKNLDEDTARIRSLTDVIGSMTLEGIVGDGEEHCLEPEDLTAEVGDLYYVTNKSAFRGAMSIFSNDTHKKIGQAIGDYYIIPSSIHELLIVSCDVIEASFISDMVKSVNASGIVADKDILSDEVYKFDSAAGKIVTMELSEGMTRDADMDLGK